MRKLGWKWADEPKLDEELRKLFADKAMPSASVIAARLNAKFGGDFTRNSVIGRLNRLGLFRGKDLAEAKARGGKKSAEAQRAHRRAPPAPKPRPLPQAKIIELPKPQAPVMPNGLVQLVDLQPLHCRWPVGDPRHADFGFCGAVKLCDGPYCNTHANRAYSETLTPEQRADAVRKARAVRDLTRGVRRYA